MTGVREEHYQEHWIRGKSTCGLNASGYTSTLNYLEGADTSTRQANRRLKKLPNDSPDLTRVSDEQKTLKNSYCELRLITITVC